MITKRQLYKLKWSLHLGEAFLPEETMSKPRTMLPPRETVEESASSFIGGNMTS